MTGVSAAPCFRDRHAAGVALGERLRDVAGREAVVLGMARGGVVVARPIAQRLSARCEAFVARKLGVPGLEEVAFGAVAEGGGKQPVLDVVHEYIGLPAAVVNSTLARERVELSRRVQQYRDGASLPELAGRTVIVVDDGLASGATLRAAGITLRRYRPARLIAAIPVASCDGLKTISGTFDEVVTLATPEPFGLVSDWYDDFAPVTDADVRSLLGRAVLAPGGETSPAHDSERLVAIPAGETGSAATLAGDLGIPARRTPKGLVVFAHGGGSSRGSYRNRYLAGRLRVAGWATLRVDLLSESEHAADLNGDHRFDIDLITRRLLAAARWCLTSEAPGAQRLVLFGASTGAAAAMGVAAAMPDEVAAVVSRGGRIDLALDSLARVRAPSLLVVGGADMETLRLNRESMSHIAGRATLRIVRGAGHTFEETGALGAVGELVTGWLERRTPIHRLLRIFRAHRFR